MEFSIPAIRRLQLGHVLRDLRKQANLSIEQAGPDLDTSSSTLNRIENGQVRVHPMIVKGALDLYDATFDQIEEVMAIAREAYKTTWWVMQGIAVDSYPALESEAVFVRNFEVTLVPGLLQAEEYAAALFTLDSAKQRNRNLAIRLNRIERLYGDNPLDLHAVIDEGALHRLIGGAEVMRGQLVHLLEVGKLPNVKIQVLPLAIGPSIGLRGAFNLLTFPTGTIDDLAYIEHAAGSLQISKATKVKDLRSQFKSLARLAADEEESARLISRLADR